METLKQNCMEECWRDVMNIIFKQAHKFNRLYGYDFDELVCVGNLAVMQAYDTHKKEFASFITWAHICVNNAMLQYRNMENKSQQCKMELMNRESHHHNVSSSPLIDLLDELDDDGKTIVQLILNTSSDLQNLLASTGGSIRHIKKNVVKYLINLGWGRARIKRSFKKIQIATVG